MDQYVDLPSPTQSESPSACTYKTRSIASARVLARSQGKRPMRNNVVVEEEEPNSQNATYPSTTINRGISREYRPKVFEDVVGHGTIVKALTNAVRRKRISPLYLFHGPGGTGKTSVAKIFAMSLNCENHILGDSISSLGPCWACTGCKHTLHTAHLCSGNQSWCVEKIPTMIQSSSTSASGFLNIFVIEESWPWGEEILNVTRAMEETRCESVVFVLILEDASKLPRAVSSRCQNFSFSKLTDGDVLLKLSRIAAQEGIEISNDALQLVARKADGNMREAENFLEQLALLDSTITAPMVQDLVGLVPRSELVHLIEAAFSGNSTEAVRCTRDLIGIFGTQPRNLMSQLASVLTELLTDTGSSLSLPASKDQRSIKGNELPQRLSQALKVVIDTEKQLVMFPCNHTTLVTAAILQIAFDGGSYHGLTDEVYETTTNRLDSGDMKNIRPIENNGCNKNTITEHLSNSIGNDDVDVKSIDMNKLWHNILEGIQNKTMRDFLKCQAELISLTASQANAIVHLMLSHSEEMSVESIGNTLKAALGCTVTLNISRKPTEEVVRENSFDRIPKPTHSGAPNSRRRSVDRNSTSEKSRSRVQMSMSETGHRGSRESSLKEVKMESFRRDSQHLDTTSTARAAALKLQLLSLSSIPQTDASIEPYSQDLLFEEANFERLQNGERYSRVHKDYLKPKEYRRNSIHRNSTHYMNSGRFNRSWSCTENFCRGDNLLKVNEGIMGFPTDRNLLNWLDPCKDSTNINSVTDKAQTNLRKSVQKNM